MVEESSFSHGVTLDDLDDAGKLITVENLDSFTVIYERKKEIIISFLWSGADL